MRFYRSLVPRYWKINFSVRVIPACLQSLTCIDNLGTSQLLGVSISEFKGLKREVRGPCGSFRRFCQSGGNRSHYESQDVSRGQPNVLSQYKRESGRAFSIRIDKSCIEMHLLHGASTFIVARTRASHLRLTSD